MRKTGMVALTFDDGNATDYTVGMQAQIDKGMSPKGTSFIIGEAISLEDRLTPSQCVAMVGNGWDIQSHGYANLHFDALTAQQIADDAKAQAAFFQNTLSLPAPQHFAYPYNGYNSTAINVLSKYVKTARTTYVGMFDKYVSPYLLNGYGFTGEAGSAATIIPYLQAAQKYGFMMTIIIHKLTGDAVTEYGLLLDAIIAAGIKTATISDIYREMIKA